MSFLQCIEKHATEKAAEDFDWQQEPAAAPNPAIVIHRQAAAGNHAVQVRVEVKVLPPGVEHGQEAQFHTEAFGVACNREQSFRGGAEEDVIDSLFVVESDGGDGFGKSEDHVEVLDR